VLQRFEKEELENMLFAAKTAAEAALCWAESGIQEAMNRYNIKEKEAKPKKSETENTERKE